MPALTQQAREGPTRRDSNPAPQGNEAHRTEPLPRASCGAHWLPLRGGLGPGEGLQLLPLLAGGLGGTCSAPPDCRCTGGQPCSPRGFQGGGASQAHTCFFFHVRSFGPHLSIYVPSFSHHYGDWFGDMGGRPQ